MAETPDSTFVALQAFRGLSAEEKIECLFLDLRGLQLSNTAIVQHLAILNGTVATTAELLRAHLQTHQTVADRQAGVRILGSNVQKVVVFGGYVLAAALAIFGILERI